MGCLHGPQLSLSWPGSCPSCLPHCCELAAPGLLGAHKVPICGSLLDLVPLGESAHRSPLHLPGMALLSLCCVAHRVPAEPAAPLGVGAANERDQGLRGRQIGGSHLCEPARGERPIRDPAQEAAAQGRQGLHHCGSDGRPVAAGAQAARPSRWHPPAPAGSCCTPERGTAAVAAVGCHCLSKQPGPGPCSNKK